MAAEWVCWRCGAAIAQPPFARADTCAACRADLHVCRLCKHFDKRVSRQCAEPIVDEVYDKQRANFCGYFEPRPGAYLAAAPAAERARGALDALFDGAQAPSEGEQARRQLGELFGAPKADEQ